MTLTVGSLFAGIGGFDLGLERAGMEVRWQVEKDPDCQRVLAKHWPDVPRYGDIKEVDPSELEPVDIICGGFPCQDISSAGQRAGIEGEHSGLWAYYARLVRYLRPRYVLVENVPALLVRGVSTVLQDLATGGFDAEWDVLPAAAFGSPQLRARVWLLAYPRGVRVQADDTVFAGRPLPVLRPAWAPEPSVGRVVDGLPRGMAGAINRENGRLGNAVVPQVAEWVGRQIVAVEETRRQAEAA